MTDLRTWLSDRNNLVRVVLPATLALIVFFIFFWILWWPNTFADPSQGVVTISRGASFASVVDSLEAKGIIHSRFALKLAAKILGGTRELKVGRYHFNSGVSNFGLLRSFRDGTSRRLIPVVIPEGVRMSFVVRRLTSELGVDSARIMKYCTDTAATRSFGIEAPNLEGYLLPDTYFFHWQTDENEIIARIVQAFKDFYSDSLVARQKEMGMSLTQVLAFASIVEGETQVDTERTIIAGVYHNRLKRRMRLEADPTVQYALADGPRRLLYRDLRINSPYNTYRHYGLPPGPINNPGRQSILATLYPAEHQYLFFVATGKGGHVFSKSYSDHQKAVKSYRRVRREMLRAARLGG